ncbi:MAG: bifunctional 5,10-methylenetetrahydrofolate dehydrogenase/5,10-methenyltetrahydrofolate cyclohydrolase [Candidatus Harrisonbacteria bacterium]|nr:bifunctional 5,10-methylenetetrahydrofolate dehydrogenase/5,10-methenyltetrahydrofolate cyclohydrolase [Candidatus Harrisonbacteria bacterium]
MRGIRIDGKKISQDIIDGLKRLPKPDKLLAAVLVGDNVQSKSFLKQKERMAGELGIPFCLYQHNEAILEDDLIWEIKKLNEDPEIGGIIVQLPLPKHYDRDRILSAVDPQKDIDALSLESRQFVNPLPVEVVKDILRTIDYDLRTKFVAVVGRGFLVGKPIIEYFKDNCLELTVFDSKSDLKDLKKADLVITAVGKGGLIKPEILKAGAGVIDFGYDICDKTCGMKHETDTKKIHGDLDASSSKLQDLGFYTPTPGGTGPILVAEIFKNFYRLADLQKNKSQ